MRTFRPNFFCGTRDREGEKGFVLPLAIFLVFMLSISGAGFLQLDFTERLMARKELDHQDSFYLANAGIERARDAFKIPDSLSWTSVLADVDESPDPRLCPNPERGCAIPPFGGSVNAGLPFDNLFDAGAYQVRAFNNVENPVTCPGPQTKDCDGRIILRALGTVRNEQKVLEVTIRSTSGMRLISCQGNTGDPCPNNPIPGHPTVDALEGREPTTFPQLPQPSPSFTDPNNYYRKPSNFPTLSACVFTGTIQSNCHYIITGNVAIQNANANNVVIFVTGKLEIKTGTTLTNAVLVGVTGVEFKGNGTISSPLPYPAVISGGNVTKSSGSATIFGNIYAAGTVDFDPITVHGSVMGSDVKIQGTSSTYTDDGNLSYYDLMPGFSYTLDQKKTATVTNSWREID